MKNVSQDGIHATVEGEYSRNGTIKVLAATRRYAYKGLTSHEIVLKDADAIDPTPTHEETCRSAGDRKPCLCTSIRKGRGVGPWIGRWLRCIVVLLFF